jgi:superfamily I DNA/RNA helicase
VVGVGDQQMPHPNARGQEELEEEMRLLYVAVTRAKDDLLVSYTTKTMMGREQKVCRYLPDDLLWRSFMAPAVISTSDIPRSPVATLSRGPQK